MGVSEAVTAAGGGPAVAEGLMLTVALGAGVAVGLWDGVVHAAAKNTRAQATGPQRLAHGVDPVPIKSVYLRIMAPN